MKKIIFIVLLGQGLLSTSVYAATGDIAAGKNKFNSSCVSCHGSKGERKALGISKIIAEIGNVKVITKVLLNIKNNGTKLGINTAMVNIASNLSNKDIKNLSVYIATFKK